MTLLTRLAYFTPFHSTVLECHGHDTENFDLPYEGKKLNSTPRHSNCREKG